MKEMLFTIDIDAPKEKVWDTLWEDATFRQWAGIIDPGTHMVGELEEGNEVQYISDNGYGVTSLVEKLVPGELLQLKHRADTQDNGTRSRDDEWTGGSETYVLTEEDYITVLSVAIDVPEEMKEYFAINYQKAFYLVKELAELDIDL